MAVSSTLRIEEGGRRAVMDSAIFAKLERAAPSVGRAVMLAREALGVSTNSAEESILSSQGREIRVILSPNFVWGSEGDGSEPEECECLAMHGDDDWCRKEVYLRVRNVKECDEGKV